MAFGCFDIQKIQPRFLTIPVKVKRFPFEINCIEFCLRTFYHIFNRTKVNIRINWRKPVAPLPSTTKKAQSECYYSESIFSFHDPPDKNCKIRQLRLSEDNNKHHAFHLPAPAARLPFGPPQPFFQYGKSITESQV